MKIILSPWPMSALTTTGSSTPTWPIFLSPSPSSRTSLRREIIEYRFHIGTSPIYFRGLPLRSSTSLQSAIVGYSYCLLVSYYSCIIWFRYIQINILETHCESGMMCKAICAWQLSSIIWQNKKNRSSSFFKYFVNGFQVITMCFASTFWQLTAC